MRLRRRQSPRKATPAELRVGISLLAVIVTLCVLVPVLSPYGTEELVTTPFEAPSGSHLFGTDSLGRDVFVRVWTGGRLDLTMALLIVSISFIIGTLVGIATGASNSRWIDSVVMRFTDALIAFPFMVWILAVIVIVGRERTFWFLPAGAPAIIVAFLLLNWSIYARLARTETLSLKSRDFVTAGAVLGYPQRRIITGHLLPGVIRITSAYAVADVILVIVATASLSFLGAGVEAPAAEWGSIMYEGRSVMTDAWWITVIPGMTLALTGLAVFLIADSLLEVER